jgi:hypothetical protein
VAVTPWRRASFLSLTLIERSLFSIVITGIVLSVVTLSITEKTTKATSVIANKSNVIFI